MIFNTLMDRFEVEDATHAILFYEFLSINDKNVAQLTSVVWSAELPPCGQFAGDLPTMGYTAMQRLTLAILLSFDVWRKAGVQQNDA